jgi:hypothetical protein
VRKRHSISPPLLFIKFIIFIIMSNERNEIIQPSGPDGDYTEKDIQQIRKGKAVVSLRLIPDGGVLRLFQASEDKNLFVRFKKITSSCEATIIFSCLHEIAVASSASKQQKICCSAEIKVNIDPHNKGQGEVPT